MLALDGAIEFPNWPNPEYLYRENRASTLIAARKLLVSKSPTLEEFFKAEEEIGKLPERPELP